MDIYQKYKDHVEKSFFLAENNQSKITEDIKKIEGMSSYVGRHFYNNLCSMEGARYLEIGSWKGSSLCAAMYNNSLKIFCIDNWSESYNGVNIKQDFIKNLNKYKGENDVTFLEADCFNLDVSKLPKFNIYLYDGHHGYDSQYKALSYYINNLDDIFIFIVDDWNWDWVRKGTRDAIKNLKLKSLYEKEVIFDVIDYNYRKNGWWNGIYIGILSKI